MKQVIEKKQLENGFAYFILEGKYLVSGQPSEEDFSFLRKLSPLHIINLRNKKEFSDFNEALLMEEMSLPYDNIPIIQEGDFHKDSLESVCSILSSLKEEEKVLIHCAAGQRASIALMAFLIKSERISKKEAPEMAENLGLKKPELLNRLLEIL